MRSKSFGMWLLGAALAGSMPVVGGEGVETSISYQGQLKKDGLPANGTFDLRFDLLDAGVRVARTCVFDVQVVNGLFTVELGFGTAVFDGRPLALQVAAKQDLTPQINDCSPNTADPFTSVGPPQAITATPYCLHALSAGNGHALDAPDGTPVNALVVDNAGNVGMGAAAPEGKLHVSGGSAGTVTANDDSVLVLEDSSDTYLSLLTPDASEQGILFGSPGSALNGAMIFNNAAVPDGLLFRTNGFQNRMVINADGNVGIGTTAPGMKLDVAGDARLVSLGTALGPNLHLIHSSATGATNNNGRITFSRGAFNTPGSSRSHIAYDNLGAKALTFNFFDVDTAASVETMRLTENGDVGIGTNDPDRRLHVSNGNSGVLSHSATALVVEDDGNCYISATTPDASERGLAFGSPASSVHGGIYYTNAGGMTLRTGGNNTRMLIESGGDVGIGTTGLGNGIDARLHVASSSARPAKFDRFGNDGELVAFARDDSLVGNITVTNGAVSYNAFTGSHYAWSAVAIEAGALVSMTGENRRLGERASSEVVYGIHTTTNANDSACLGVLIGLAEPDEESSPQNPLLVAAVGNADLCVVDRGGGDIEPGDYLISSGVPGCAMKDDPQRFAVGHIIARSAEVVSWAQVLGQSPSEPKRKTISVLFESFTRQAEIEHFASIVKAQQQALDSLRNQLAEVEKRLSLVQAGDGPKVALETRPGGQ